MAQESPATEQMAHRSGMCIHPKRPGIPVYHSSVLRFHSNATCCCIERWKLGKVETDFAAESRTATRQPEGRRQVCWPWRQQSGGQVGILHASSCTTQISSLECSRAAMDENIAIFADDPVMGLIMWGRSTLFRDFRDSEACLHTSANMCHLFTRR